MLRRVGSDCVVLCCVLLCSVLFCSVLFCSRVWCCIVLYCIVSSCIVLTVTSCSVLYFSVLFLFVVVLPPDSNPFVWAGGCNVWERQKVVQHGLLAFRSCRVPRALHVHQDLVPAVAARGLGRDGLHLPRLFAESRACQALFLIHL